MLPIVTPHLVAENGITALRAGIAGRLRFACEPKIDAVRWLLVHGDGIRDTRNRHGVRRDWLRGDDFEHGLRGLAR